MLFSLLKPYLDSDTALKVSQSVYCFTTSISNGVENYFPRLWGTDISDAIFFNFFFIYFFLLFFVGTLLIFVQHSIIHSHNFFCVWGGQCNVD